jgi:hypothetical protein
MKAVSLMLKVFFSQEITAIEARNIIANMCKTGKCRHAFLQLQVTKR